MGHPTGLWYLFSQWCPISETWHCASPAPYKVLKTYLQFHARFLRSQMELALLCTFLSMVQLIKYKHSLLIKFLTYQITNLMEIQWNVCCSAVKLAEYNQIQRVDVHCKGLCPSYWMHVQIGVSLFKHCRRYCQSNRSVPWRKSRWKNIWAAYLHCQQIICKIH